MWNLIIKLKSVFTQFLAVIIGCIVLLCNCGTNHSSDQSPENITESPSNSNSSIHHATGFDLVVFDGFKILHIINHNDDTSDTLSYLLKEKGVEIPAKFSSIQQIEVPVESIALLHSSYVSFFDYCNAEDHIKAISEVQYVFDSSIFKSVTDGLLPEVGYGETLDKEQLLELEIQLVITVGFPNVPNKSQQMLEELGIPVLVFSDWQESTLLARAEWVKVIAALTGSDQLCEEKFNQTEREYNRLKSLTAKIDNPPTVICNLPYKGAWYVPGGNSYMSNALQDAGADYLWSDIAGTGGVQIDFEVAFAEGLTADYWLNTDIINRIDEITDKDKRLSDFRPILTDRVFNNNNRVARGVANDCWESGLIYPEIILADMIKIFHPELLPNHQLYYYKHIQ